VLLRCCCGGCRRRRRFRLFRVRFTARRCERALAVAVRTCLPRLVRPADWSLELEREPPGLSPRSLVRSLERSDRLLSGVTTTSAPPAVVAISLTLESRQLTTTTTTTTTPVLPRPFATLLRSVASSSRPAVSLQLPLPRRKLQTDHQRRRAFAPSCLSVFVVVVEPLVGAASYCSASPLCRVASSRVVLS